MFLSLPQQIRSCRPLRHADDGMPCHATRYAEDAAAASAAVILRCCRHATRCCCHDSCHADATPASARHYAVYTYASAICCAMPAAADAFALSIRRHTLCFSLLPPFAIDYFSPSPQVLPLPICVYAEYARYRPYTASALMPLAPRRCHWYTALHWSICHDGTMPLLPLMLASGYERHAVLIRFIAAMPSRCCRRCRHAAVFAMSLPSLRRLIFACCRCRYAIFTRYEQDISRCYRRALCYSALLRAITRVKTC